MSEHDQSSSANPERESPCGCCRDEWQGVSKRFESADNAPEQGLPQYYLPCTD
jgi:hypothetical protein